VAQPVPRVNRHDGPSCRHAGRGCAGGGGR
jgi:hypothetical protein